LIAALLTCASLAAFFLIPPWAFMWTAAWSMFFLAKLATLPSPSGFRGLRGFRGSRRVIAYLFAWPGMNAGAFLDTTRNPVAPRPAEWLAALTRTFLGIALVWLVARRVHPHSPYLATWLGMIGLILCLHFGSFHLLSCLWRRAGVDAPPIMNRPLASASLTEFWGKRWNLGFHALAERFVFRPLRRPLGVRGAMLAVFVASGLVHELVISLPARAGFGLPTAYFALQGLGIVLERSHTGRPRKRLGLDGGAASGGRGGRLFAITLTALPAVALFHPWFVARVAEPFLAAIGAF
jgi:alginate O-acetyltransferase complex protein AlgI